MLFYALYWLHFLYSRESRLLKKANDDMNVLTVALGMKMWIISAYYLLSEK